MRLSAIKRRAAPGFFTFSTPLTVKIHSKELGFLYWTSIVSVFIYIVFMQFFLNHGYLRFQPAQNSVRLTLQEPTVHCDPNFNKCLDDYTDFDQLSYCCTDRCTWDQDRFDGCTCGVPGLLRVHNFQCARLDGAEAAIATSNTLLVATAFHQVDQELNPDCFTNSSFNSDSMHCDKLWHGKQRWTSYVGDIERFTVLASHTLEYGSFSVPSAEMRGGKLEVAGDAPGQQLLCSNHPQASTSPIAGDVFCRSHPDAAECSYEDIQAALTNSTPCFVPPTGSVQGNDFFRLQLFMGAIGMSLNNVNAKGSYRLTGMVLNLAIEYSNVRRWGFGKTPIWYVYRASKVADGHGETQIIRNTGLTRQRRSTRGVLVNVQARGSLGEYNLHSSLVSLATGSTLASIAALLVKLVATNFMGDKDKFLRAMVKEKKMKHKWEEAREEPLLTENEVDDGLPTI